jgi:hypothetical protein
MKHASLKLTALALGLAASSAFAAIDPVLLNLAPPNSTALAGIQVDQGLNSSLGQYLLAQLKPNTQLDSFITLTGFDPRRDLKQVLVAAAGTQGVNNHAGLVLGRGVFETSKLSAAVSIGGGTKTTYSGIDIYSSKDDDMNSVAFLDSSTVAIGDATSVKGAIDRFRAGSSVRADLAQRAIDQSNLYQAWFVTTSMDQLSTGISATAPGSPVPVNALQSILQAAGGLKLGADAVTFGVEAVTRTDKDAQSLVDVVKFFASMIQMNRNTDPNAQRAAAIIDTATITATGTTMRVNVAVPQQDIMQFLNQQPKAVPSDRKPKTRASR